MAIFFEVLSPGMTDRGNRPLSLDPVLTRLPAGDLVPRPGDTILLPKALTGDDDERAFDAGRTPFHVTKVVHDYGAEKGALGQEPTARYERCRLVVAREPKDQWQSDLGFVLQ